MEARTKLKPKTVSVIPKINFQVEEKMKIETAAL